MGFGIQRLWFGVQGSGFRVQGLGFGGYEPVEQVVADRLVEEH